MTQTKIKELRYKKAKNIQRNNLSKDTKDDYDCSRKFGLVRTTNTKKDRKKSNDISKVPTT